MKKLDTTLQKRRPKRVHTEVHHREPGLVETGMKGCMEWIWEMRGERVIRVAAAVTLR